MAAVALPAVQRFGKAVGHVMLTWPCLLISPFLYMKGRWLKRREVQRVQYAHSAHAFLDMLVLFEGWHASPISPFIYVATIPMSLQQKVLNPSPQLILAVHHACLLAAGLF